MLKLKYLLVVFHVCDMIYMLYMVTCC